MPNLDETHASFGESPGDENLSSLYRVAIHASDVLRFTAQIEGFASGRLHVKRLLVRLNSRFEKRIARASLQMVTIQPLHKVKLLALLFS